MAAGIRPTDTLAALGAILEDANGLHTFSAERAQFGYIPASKFLFVPEDLAFSSPPDINLELLGRKYGLEDYIGGNGLTYRRANPYIKPGSPNIVSLWKIIAINFIKLTGSSMSDQAAFLASVLRARWIKLGCLWQDPSERKTPFDEVEYATNDDDDIKGIVDCSSEAELFQNPIFSATFARMQPHFASEFYGFKFAIKYAETIWGISELVFRIRGHHYKPAYEDLIKRTFRATTEGEVDLPDAFEYAAVFHTAIHPFGVRALPTMAAHFIAWGKTGNSLVIRFSGAPNGTALFTTTSAGIRMLASEAWYNRFEATYKTPITEVHDMARQILDNKYSYHQAAGLYGLNRSMTVTVNNVDISLSEAEQRIGVLAPPLQGFVNGVKNAQQGGSRITFAYGNQAVLQKRAGTNPMLAMKMELLIEKIITKLQEATKTADVMDSFLNKDETAGDSQAVVRYVERS